MADNNPNGETPRALVLHTLTREGAAIVCRPYVVTGAIVLGVLDMSVPLRWRERAILLTDDEPEEG